MLRSTSRTRAAVARAIGGARADRGSRRLSVLSPAAQDFAQALPAYDEHPEPPAYPMPMMLKMYKPECPCPKSRLYTEQGGVFHIADDELRDMRYAATFPAVKFRDLSGEVFETPSSVSGVTLLGLALCQPAMDQLISWRKGFVDHFGDSDRASFRLGLLYDNLLFRAAPSLVQWMLTKGGGVSEEHLPHILYHTGEYTDLRRKLEYRGRMQGHIFLLDERGRVRWRAMGAPHQQGYESMIRATQDLIAKRSDAEDEAVP